jgi:hypothetical protein
MYLIIYIRTDIYSSEASNMLIRLLESLGSLGCTTGVHAIVFRRYFGRIRMLGSERYHYAGIVTGRPRCSLRVDCQCHTGSREQVSPSIGLDLIIIQVTPYELLHCEFAISISCHMYIICIVACSCVYVYR